MLYSQKELQIGTAIERQSTHDTPLAEKIAMGNLREDADHYKKLRASGLGSADDEAGQFDAGAGDAGGAVEECGGNDSTSSHVAPLQSSKLGDLAPGKSPQLKSSELMECGCPIGGCECGGAEGAGPEVSTVKVVKVSTGPNGEAAPTKPLTSSGLGNNGVPKPLTSDQLQAPKGDNIIPTLPDTPAKAPAEKNQMFADSIADEEGNAKTNSVRVGKTPGVGGKSADAMNHFGALISTALKDEVPRRAEMIPAAIYEGGAKLKKK